MTRRGDRCAGARASFRHGEPTGSRGQCPLGNRVRGEGTTVPSATGCVWSAVDPPRPIPNRVVKHRSADPTGGSPLGT